MVLQTECILKSGMILKQHIPYAATINRALDFCENMLVRSRVLYPFAVLSIDNDLHCIFVPSETQHAESGMIEQLQERINERKLFAENAVSLLVYSATVMNPNKREVDALVFTITDKQGQNTVTIYPYKHVETGIKIFAPYTCDFSD